jgi:hypothetical protein
VNLKGEKKVNVKKRAYLFSGKNRIANFPPSPPYLQINPSRIPGREKKSSQIPGQKGRKRRFCLNFRDNQAVLYQKTGQRNQTAAPALTDQFKKQPGVLFGAARRRGRMGGGVKSQKGSEESKGAK